jgi:hypothetical protein
MMQRTGSINASLAWHASFISKNLEKNFIILWDVPKKLPFFNSRDQGEPISFKVGTDKVIEGWNIGVIGIQVGGKRRLLVPSKLAYGAEGAGQVIPPNAALIFEIELLEVKKSNARAREFLQNEYRSDSDYPQNYFVAIKKLVLRPYTAP